MTGAPNTTGRWDYHVEQLGTSQDHIAERLAELGADRWELVTTFGSQWIFKRPAPTLAEQITIDQRTRVQHEKEAGA